MSIINRTISAATATDLFPQFSGIGGFILTSDAAGRVQFGADASATSGEPVFANSPTRFSYQEFPELNSRISFFSTPGANISIRMIS